GTGRGAARPPPDAEIRHNRAHIAVSSATYLRGNVRAVTAWHRICAICQYPPAKSAPRRPNVGP
ncbi:MAG: hypothetical protein QOJ59_3046, partial [Thermomicrobiales bacterium]|nr:hypothetical protein [Thermomicrobiales bacterium]